MASKTPRPMPWANWSSSTMLCARKINTESSLGSACHQPPQAPGQPTEPAPPPHRIGSAFSGSITTATPMPNPWPAAKIGIPSNFELARCPYRYNFDSILTTLGWPVKILIGDRCARQLNNGCNWALALWSRRRTAPRLSRALRVARGQRFGSEPDEFSIRLALSRFVGNFFCLRRKVACSFGPASPARSVFFHRDVDLLHTAAGARCHGAYRSFPLQEESCS